MIARAKPSKRLNRIAEISKIGAAAPAGTIERLYLDKVRPKTKPTSRDRWWTNQAWHDVAIIRFNQWRRVHTPIVDLSDELIDQFEQCSIASGYCELTAERHAVCIRNIIRTIRPDVVRPRFEGRGSGPNKRKGQSRKLIEQPAAEGTVRHFFEAVYRPRRLQGGSGDTVRLYRNSIRNFASSLGREPVLTDLTDDHLAAFQAWHLERGHSPETANKDSGQLMAMGRFAARKRFLEVEPELKLLRCPKRAPMAWMKDELARLFQAVDKLPGRVGPYPAREWWKALLLVSYYTGERSGALLGLEWPSVDLVGAWIIVPAELRKGRRADKVFPLPPVAIKALLKIHPADNSGKVFSWPLNLSMIYLRLKAIHRRAGLPCDRRSMFHRMRRTAASWFKFAGGDPQSLLDHADAKTTTKYIDPRICTSKSAAELLDDPTVQIGGAA